MTDVTVGRLSATIHGSREEGARVDRIFRRMSGDRLGHALREIDLPPGIWCVRRLDVPVRPDLGRPDGALERAWAVAVARTLCLMLASESPDVVRYGNVRDALVDLVQSVSTGRRERVWAWRRMGLSGDADRSPGQEIIAALAPRPEHALGVIAEVSDRIGMAPLDRVLGPAGWAAVVETVKVGLGLSARPTAEPYRFGGVEELAGTLIRSSRLAEAVRYSRVRAGADTIAAWAFLVAAEADVSVLRRSAGEAVIDAVRLLLAARSGNPREIPGVTRDEGASAAPLRRPAVEPGLPEAGPPVESGLPEAGSAVEPGLPEAGPPVESADQPIPPEWDAAGLAYGSHRAGEPIDRSLLMPERKAPRLPYEIGRMAEESGRRPSPERDVHRLPYETRRPDGDRLRASTQAGCATEWGGLMFLLALAPAAGIPQNVLDDPVFAVRSLPWVLRHVALRLVPASADDPVVAAFAGLDPESRIPTDTPEPQEELRLAEIAHRWTAVTAAALEGGDRDPLDAVHAVARRPGRIFYAPGWTEVHLAIDGVDLDVRRAGLDLDPGWVPWLGTVVRFVYG